jgi:hypothetical protein
MQMNWTIERDANDYSVVEGNRRVAGYIVERKAARIMAAAPDLLEALMALHANVEELSGFWNESTSNFMQQAEAAIAKAKGK